MMLMMQILVVLGLGLVGYAIFGVFTTGKTPPPSKLKIQDPPGLAEDPGKEQKIQRLQSQIAKLESQLEESKVVSAGEKSGQATIKEKEAEFAVELKRREEWVAKAEAELAKIKAENVDLNNKFTAKEKELEEEFTKNVNLTREMREIKAALEAKEMACRLKEDQLQVQKHQAESQLKTINEHLTTIAEFSRKEKISEWVPKSEFNQLNEEYTKLEKDLEASQERLKSFAAEIAHLRPAVEKKPHPPEEVGLPQVSAEGIKPEKVEPEGAQLAENKTAAEEGSASQETQPQTIVPEKVKPEVVNKTSQDSESQTVVPAEVQPDGQKLPEKIIAEENKVLEDEKTAPENKASEEINPVENNPEKKTQETPPQE